MQGGSEIILCKGEVRLFCGFEWFFGDWLSFGGICAWDRGFFIVKIKDKSAKIQSKMKKLATKTPRHEEN